MTLKKTSTVILQTGRVGATLLIVAALMVPGCAGKRSDLFSSLLPSKSTADSSDAAVADDSEPADDDPPLIAQADKSAGATWLSALKGDENEGEAPTPRITIGQRFRRLLGRSDTELVTADPFVEADSEAETVDENEVDRKPAIAKGEGPTVEELLASFEAATDEQDAAHDKPWWEQGESNNASTKTAAAADGDSKFAKEFDSRLNRLRAELTTEDTGKASAKQQVAAKTGPHPMSRSLEERAREIFGEAGHPLAEQPRVTPAAKSPKARVTAMMDDAQRDWENWNLRKAYRTALDAQELALQENVRFSLDEMPPKELVDLIAADLRGDAITQVASTPRQDRSVSLFSNQEDAAFDFAVSKSNRRTDRWITAGEHAVASGDAEKATAVEPIPTTPEPKEESRGSGVSLLPPDDDFPSEAAGIWKNQSPEAGATGAAGESSNGIRLATHKSPGFTLTRDGEPKRQFPGLSDDDNAELLTTVAQQRSRVFEERAAKWPSLRSPDQLKSRRGDDGGPIRVAQAPRFAPGDEMPAGSNPVVIAESAGSSGSLLGQFWRSQSVWFIGGLLLLMIALRLMPRPRNESE